MQDAYIPNIGNRFVIMIIATVDIEANLFSYFVFFSSISEYSISRVGITDHERIEILKSRIKEEKNLSNKEQLEILTFGVRVSLVIKTVEILHIE